jgi:hypothetical protein
MQQPSLVTNIVFLLVLELAFVSAVTPAASRNARGSLVVAIVSSKGDYMVIAAESRNTNGSDRTPANDEACKIISLGAKTLFFETGESEYRAHQGELWDARAVAREIYLKSKDHDPHALSLAWIKKAQRWFAQLPNSEMRSVTSASDGEIGKISAGGFAAFGADGIPKVDDQSLFYSFADRTFSNRPEFAPPAPGQIAGSGLGLGLIDEFFRMQTLRATLARGSDSVGTDSVADSRIAANAIHFAENYSTEPEKSQLGGPIDVAMLRKNQAVEWADRKDKCYQDDLKASRTTSNRKNQTQD